MILIAGEGGWLRGATVLRVGRLPAWATPPSRRAYREAMNVTLLYFDDCPSWRVTDAHLRSLAAEHPGIVIERRIVDTADDAEATRFRGSPSIIVDGIDPFAEPDAPVGLACRIYQTPSGPAGSPTLDQLRSVICGV